MVSKKKRLQLFLQRLEAANCARSAEEALALLSDILDAVEDEYSGAPNNPQNWEMDGRMYPPQKDSTVKCPDHPLLHKYRNKGHYDFIGPNGSIRIETLRGETLLDKPGLDGQKTYELDC